jgi:hypothetical protein
MGYVSGEKRKVNIGDVDDRSQMGGYFFIVFEEIGWKVAEWILLAKNIDQRQVIVDIEIILADLQNS